MTRLMSVMVRAIVAATKTVAQPRIAPTSAAAGACSNRGHIRAIRYTPAVTIVAAWISAETGVGPSIASGSQVWSGTCADLANAPTRNRMHAATSVPSLTEKAWWVAPNTRNAPTTIPMSPITLMTNALMPAYVAVPRRYQNEINRYDAAPTNAQPTIRRTKLPAITSNRIEKT